MHIMSDNRIWLNTTAKLGSVELGLVEVDLDQPVPVELTEKACRTLGISREQLIEARACVRRRNASDADPVQTQPEPATKPNRFQRRAGSVKARKAMRKAGRP
jgi:hypothetical protein